MAAVTKGYEVLSNTLDGIVQDGNFTNDRVNYVARNLDKGLELHGKREVQKRNYSVTALAGAAVFFGIMILPYHRILKVVQALGIVSALTFGYLSKRVAAEEIAAAGSVKGETKENKAYLALQMGLAVATNRIAKSWFVLDPWTKRVHDKSFESPIAWCVGGLHDMKAVALFACVYKIKKQDAELEQDLSNALAWAQSVEDFDALQTSFGAKIESENINELIIQSIDNNAEVSLEELVKIVITQLESNGKEAVDESTSTSLAPNPKEHWRLDVAMDWLADYAKEREILALKHAVSIFKLFDPDFGTTFHKIEVLEKMPLAVRDKDTFKRLAEDAANYLTSSAT